MTSKAGKPGPLRTRPRVFNDALGEVVCKQLADGKTLREICSQPGMPTFQTIAEWAIRDPDGFGRQYTRAREIGWELMAEQLPEIADKILEQVETTITEGRDGLTTSQRRADAVRRAELMINTRKWILSKRLPHLFGQKLAVDAGGKGSVTITLSSDDAAA